MYWSIVVATLVAIYVLCKLVFRKRLIFPPRTRRGPDIVPRIHLRFSEDQTNPQPEFAPLLALRQLDIDWEHVDADTVDHFEGKAILDLIEGTHEVPFSTNANQPPLLLHAIKDSQCHISIEAGTVLLPSQTRRGNSFSQPSSPKQRPLGSRHISPSTSDESKEDQDAMHSLPSKTHVKSVEINCSPALAVSNVAPALFQLQQLLEVLWWEALLNWMHSTPYLYRPYLVLTAGTRFLSYLVERLLSFVEKLITIQLERVRAIPRGSNYNPILQLEFTGYVRMLWLIKIPFWSVQLPHFIIPPLHSVLQDLLTEQPLSNARLLTHRLPKYRLAKAGANIVQCFTGSFEVRGQLSAILVQLNLPDQSVLNAELSFPLSNDSGSFNHSPSSRAASTSPHSRPRGYDGLSRRRGRANKNSDDTSETRGLSLAADLANRLSGNRSRRVSLSSTSSCDENDFSGDSDSEAEENPSLPWMPQTTFSASVEFGGAISKSKIELDMKSVHITSTAVEGHTDVLFEGSLEIRFPTEAEIEAAKRAERISSRRKRMRRRHRFKHFESFGNEADMDHQRIGDFETKGDNSTWNDAAQTSRQSIFSESSEDEFEPFKEENSDEEDGGLSWSSINSGDSIASVLVDSVHTMKLTRVLHYVASGNIRKGFLDSLLLRGQHFHPQVHGNMQGELYLSSLQFGGLATSVATIRRKRDFAVAPNINFTFDCDVQMPGGRRSCFDDGETRFSPELREGQIHGSVIGSAQTGVDIKFDSEGLVAMSSRTVMVDFPELGLVDVDLLSNLEGSIETHGRIRLTTRAESDRLSKADLCGSHMQLKLNRARIDLGSRWLEFPRGCTINSEVLHCTLDVTGIGRASVLLDWDLGGYSPILDDSQTHEEPVEIFVPGLLTGDLIVSLSEVGGISVSAARALSSNQVTDTKKALYDWRFFKSILKPGSDLGRWLQLADDDESTGKVLRASQIFSEDVHTLLAFLLRQFKHVRRICQDKGIEQPMHIIPRDQLARVISLVLCNSSVMEKEFAPIIKQVTEGKGLPVPKVKNLLRQIAEQKDSVEVYDEWEMEVDKALRWISKLLGPVEPVTPLRTQEDPLPLRPHYRRLFDEAKIPSAAELYTRLHSIDPNKPFSSEFCRMVAIIAPYLTLAQLHYVISRHRKDWPKQYIWRIKYILELKQRVHSIAQNYGGVSFVPQCRMIAFFLGGAINASKRWNSSGDRVDNEAGAADMNLNTESKTASDTSKALDPNRSSSYLVQRAMAAAADVEALELENSEQHETQRDRSRRRKAENRSTRSSTTTSRPNRRHVRRSSFRRSKNERRQASGYRLYPERSLSSSSQISTDPSSVSSRAAGSSSSHDQEGSEFILQLGSSFLGPKEVGHLLQSGLASVSQGGAVQMNQRMLLSLAFSQPPLFLRAVLCEMAGFSVRSLSAILISLLEMRQDCFKDAIDLHAKFEERLSIQVPRRQDFMAGGRWARQSYYEAIFHTSKLIMDEIETYCAFKNHVQIHIHDRSNPSCFLDNMSSTESRTSGDRMGRETSRSVKSKILSKIKSSPLKRSPHVSTPTLSSFPSPSIKPSPSVLAFDGDNAGGMPDLKLPASAIPTDSSSVAFNNPGSTSPLRKRNLSVPNFDPPVPDLSLLIEDAQTAIQYADELGFQWLEHLETKDSGTLTSSYSDVHHSGPSSFPSHSYIRAKDAYLTSFELCQRVLKVDPHAFKLDWFKEFWQRNYEALMVVSVASNCIDNIDNVRRWVQFMCNRNPSYDYSDFPGRSGRINLEKLNAEVAAHVAGVDLINIASRDAQNLVCDVIDAIYYFEADKAALKSDPLIRMLIAEEPGHYDFTVISAMGVITEGKRGRELEDAYRRLRILRGVNVVRANTGTMKTVHHNARQIEKAVRDSCLVILKENQSDTKEDVRNRSKSWSGSIGTSPSGLFEQNILVKPWGYIGYSQGCANSLQMEAMLMGGTPLQQQLLSGLRARNLLFSAANGSAHASCGHVKLHRSLVDAEKFAKFYQAVLSQTAIDAFLNTLTVLLSSNDAAHVLGGINTLSHEGAKAMYRDGQHKSTVPTCVIRGQVEERTLPEPLEMLSNILTQQIESPYHDTQVNLADAVGHPVFVANENADMLAQCDMGGLVQATHHWSPLRAAVEPITTSSDIDRCIYDTPKDRHIFPWIDVNVRFGNIARKTA